MTRVRISTTVDAQRLARARSVANTSDSKLIDRALNALLLELEGRHEREVLVAQPYEDDPDLAWESNPGPSLPYDGEVPAEVLRMAERRASPIERS